MFKNIFPRAAEVTYLDTAAEGLPLPQCEEDLREYYRAKALGTPGRREFHAVETEALDLIARLLGTDRSNVAVLGSASDALNALALSLDWNPGDQIILSDLEFPSNVLPWLRLKQKGVEVIVVRSEEGVLHWKRVAERITPRTRLISLSLVSYRNGAYLEGLPCIASEAKKAGAIVSIDATQALGRCPVKLEGVDWLISSSFKWLLGSHGLGIVYVNPGFRKQWNPPSVGWYSVKDLFSERRFERYELKDGAACLPVGMPNFPAIYCLRSSLRFLLEVGVEELFEDLKPVIERLRQGLAGLGLNLLTPAGIQYASGIVSFAHPKAKEIGEALEREKVIVWAGDGRVRASVHLYNDMSDVERYLHVLSSVLAGC